MQKSIIFVYVINKVHDYDKFEIEEKIVDMLKTVYDPEIPVNIYDLGLIYKIEVADNGEVAIDDVTAPNCRLPISSWRTFLEGRVHRRRPSLPLIWFRAGMGQGYDEWRGKTELGFL